MMNGGIIEQITLEAEGVFLQICGVGKFRDKAVILNILPTNYCLRTGDLIWWEGNTVHWEGNRRVEFECQWQETLSFH